MGKGSRVYKEKRNYLEGKLMKVKKENERVVCENDVLQRELTKLRNELSLERRNFLNHMSVYINANEEPKQKIIFFDDVKKTNEELEREMKKFKEENYLLKDELNQSIIERNACVKKNYYVVFHAVQMI